MARTTTSLHLDQDALRSQIHAIALAVCKIKGLPEPDKATIATIVSEAAAVLGDQRARKPQDVAGFLVEQIVASLG